MNMNKLFYLLLIIILFSCAGNSINNYQDLNYKFNEAKSSFESGKFSRAKEQFQFIIYNNPGSTVATNSQYYLAESYYNMENYYQASLEYDKYNMISQNAELVAKSNTLE